jgi:hypothetical protein
MLQAMQPDNLKNNFLTPWDNYVLMLLGRLGKQLMIISAYQAPKNSSSCGKTISHQQQVLQLKKDGKPDQYPRKDFCVSLDNFIDNKK